MRNVTHNYWADGIAKKVKNVQVELDVVPDGHHIPQNYQFVHCHMIFDVKMEDFCRKARYVAGGHMTNAPPNITYVSVVRCETVRTAFTLVELNRLEVNVRDIKNTYVTAPVTEKIWTKLGEEFGANADKKAIIVRAFYGLKSSYAAFRNHLAECMRNIGYASCLADPDILIEAYDKFQR